MSFNPNPKYNQVSKGGGSSFPKPFTGASPNGVRDSSGSVLKRLFSRLLPRSITPYIDTRNKQPTAGAMTNAYWGHFIGATTFIGKNAVACGAAARPYQNGMMYMPLQSYPSTGLGGLISGTQLGQELIDPNNTDLPEYLFD